MHQPRCDRIAFSEAAETRLTNPCHEKYLIVHAEAEDDTEDEYGDRRKNGVEWAVDAEQRRTKPILKDERHRAECACYDEQVEHNRLEWHQDRLEPNCENEKRRDDDQHHYLQEA